MWENKGASGALGRIALRIAGGRARGRPLRCPPGEGTRPTPARVKEAVFSMLYSRWGRPLPSDRVLDLFAGSGALGLECLSRGASSAVFVDHDPQAFACLRANLRALGPLAVSSRALMQAALPALAQLAREGQSFELVLLDPPYAGPPLAPLLRRLASSGLLADGGLVVCEHAGNLPAPAATEVPDALRLAVSRRWGAVATTIFHHLPPAEPPPCASPSTPDPSTPSPSATSTSSSEASLFSTD